MPRRSIQKSRLVAVFILVTLLQLVSAFAENRILPKKGMDNSITIELTNADAIEGFQFSIQGRGGIAWISYEGSERTTVAGLAIYQHLVNDSTLNVVILAPVRSPLPCGQGSIGRVGFMLRKDAGSDTVGVFLSKVVICDAEARYLDVSAEQLAWHLRESQEPMSPAFTLEQNYPNPFNPSTTISYKLDRPENVTLVVYDIAGRLISTLISQYQNEGRHTVQWNAADDRGSKLASGMYFARLEVGSQVAIKKMLLAK
jgi:hypothetical protein